VDQLKGIVVRGHQVASKASEHYPAGTIAMQTPFFRERGLDLSTFHPATINISIEPFQFRIAGEDYLFRNIEWTDRHPPEDFSFSRCRIKLDGVDGAWHEGWIYYPHPETKARHHQNASVIEVIAPYVDNLEYGSHLLIHLNETHIHLSKNEH
jgi:hypothetical protein